MSVSYSSVTKKDVYEYV